MFHIEKEAIKYSSPGFNSVDAYSISAAAMIFAERAARKLYGASGFCLRCTQVACSKDGKSAEYRAFIARARRDPRNQSVGHRQDFVVQAAQQNKKTKLRPVPPRRGCLLPPAALGAVEPAYYLGVAIGTG